MHPYYQKNFTIPLEAYKHAKEYYEEAITLPYYPAMTDDEVARVIEAVKELVG